MTFTTIFNCGEVSLEQNFCIFSLFTTMKRVAFKASWCSGYNSGYLSCNFIFPGLIPPRKPLTEGGEMNRVGRWVRGSTRLDRLSTKVIWRFCRQEIQENSAIFTFTQCDNSSKHLGSVFVFFCFLRGKNCRAF